MCLYIGKGKPATPHISKGELVLSDQARTYLKVSFQYKDHFACKDIVIIL